MQYLLSLNLIRQTEVRMNKTTPMKSLKTSFSYIETMMNGLFYKLEKSSSFTGSDFSRFYDFVNGANLSFHFNFKNGRKYAPAEEHFVHLIYKKDNTRLNTTLISVEDFRQTIKSIKPELLSNYKNETVIFEKFEELILNAFFKKFSTQDAIKTLEKYLVENNELEFSNLSINKLTEEMLDKRIKEKESTFDTFCYDSAEAIEIRNLEKILQDKKDNFQKIKDEKYKELTLKTDLRLLKDTSLARHYILEKITNSSIILNKNIHLSKNDLEDACLLIIQKNGA